MKLYLVRHGQSTGNIGGRLMGQSDHRLTALGEDQARAAAERLAPFGPMPVYSSDLPRARRTAEHIVAAWRGADADAPRLVVDARLREISLGDFEGRPWQEFEADAGLTASFAADPYGTALPNGESLRDLEARACAAVQDILELEAVRAEASRAEAAAAPAAGAAAAADADDGSACLVAHDGPIRAILNHYLGVPPEKWWTLSTTHGGVSLIEFAAGYVTIRYVNATGHLDGLEAEKYVPSDD
jgi:broad specificity phosphatase PhoE